MIAITGANGFLGRALCRGLLDRGQPIRPLVRQDALPSEWGGSASVIGDLGPETAWDQALAGVRCVVHCAAHVHQMGTSGPTVDDDYHRVNTLGTAHLAEEAARVGVRRLVFVSSIKVMGESTQPGRPFRFSDTPAPQDAYGRSKWAAELRLWEVARATGLEVVVVRPPLVYGPGVKANFQSLIRWVRKGIPLPLGAVHNSRSLISLGNLTDLIIRCTYHPRAVGHTFLASDGQNLSTPALIRALAQTMGRPARLVSIPISILKLAGHLTGRSGQIDRLTSSLEVDIGHTTGVLDWKPVMTVQQGLRLAVQDEATP